MHEAMAAEFIDRLFRPVLDQKILKVCPGRVSHGS